MSDIKMMMREHDRHIQTIRDDGAIMQKLRERIAELEHDNKELQSAHDKLKQRIQDAPILYTAISSNKDCDVSISQDKFHWLGLKHVSGIKAGKTVVLVELEQEEL